MVPEADKAAYYRLADAYVMPSRKEGFGFVFLEAMACGIPVIASRTDGSREAVRDGLLGALVDPDQPAELHQAIREALRKPRGVIPEGLAYFSFENFTRRVRELVDEVLEKS
jgi:glycosyltransferase involved in cell wall biosynthesis